MNLERDPFNQHSFVNPGSLRIFAVTMAAAESGLFSLQDFQGALIARIRNFEAQGYCIDSDESYYMRWTEALTDLLSTRQVLTSTRLAPVEQAVRDAVAGLHQAQDHDHHFPGAHRHAHAHPRGGSRRHPRPLFVEAAL